MVGKNDHLIHGRKRAHQPQEDSAHGLVWQTRTAEGLTQGGEDFGKNGSHAYISGKAAPRSCEGGVIYTSHEPVLPEIPLLGYMPAHGFP